MRPGIAGNRASRPGDSGTRPSPTARPPEAQSESREHRRLPAGRRIRRRNRATQAAEQRTKRAERAVRTRFARKSHRPQCNDAGTCPRRCIIVTKPSDNRSCLHLLSFSEILRIPLPISRIFYYLCRRYFEGVPYYQAEIIPIEPDTGNAETGMHNLSTHTPFQFINF